MEKLKNLNPKEKIIYKNGKNYNKGQNYNEKVKNNLNITKNAKSIE